MALVEDTVWTAGPDHHDRKGKQKQGVHNNPVCDVGGHLQDDFHDSIKALENCEAP